MSINFEELQKAILTEHNRIRQDPSSYIPILEKQISYFKGDILYRPREPGLQTFEGPSAYHEAINFLKKQKPLDALTFDERLSQAAIDHANDIGPKGLLSHDGTDGKTVSDRIEQHVEWDQNCGENIDVGSKTGQDVILSLLVDDGVKERGHRANLFKPDFKYVGIGCAPHREYEVVTIINYVGNLREKGKPFFDYDTFKYEYPSDIGSGIRETVDKSKKSNRKSKFNIDDEDAPEGTVSVRLVKTSRIYKGRKIIVTKKFYKLEDGTEHVVELEEF